KGGRREMGGRGGDRGGGHRVVLVDDRERAELQQRLERGTRVEVATAALAVLEGEQHLCHGHVIALEQLLVGMRESDLSNRCRRLALLESQRSVLQAETPPPERDRSR